MAEKITVKETSIKKGENDKGEWVNTRITTTTGIKWGGFDKNLQYLQEGDVIEITESEQKGKNLNILKWHKVEAAVAPEPRSTETKPPEYWQVERSSIEAQVAFKGIIELGEQIIAGNIKEEDKRYKKALDLALDWAELKLKANLGAMVKAEAIKSELGKAEPSKSTAGAISNGHFDNPGQFAAAAFNEYGLTASKLCEKFDVKAIKDIADLDAAWKDLKPAK